MILDVKLKKRIYEVFCKFQDIFNEVEIDYPNILEKIADEELNIKQENANRIDRDNPYPHLIGCARQIFGYRDKLDLANKFWDVQPFFYDESKLWWLWDRCNCMWNMIDEVDLFNSLDKALESDMSLKSRHRTEIIEALKRVGRGRMP